MFRLIMVVAELTANAGHDAWHQFRLLAVAVFGFSARRCCPFGKASALFTALVVGGSQQEATAALISTNSSEVDSIALGQGKVLQLDLNVPGVGTGHASAIYLNSEYVLTSGHAIVDYLPLGTTFDVRTGTNFISDSGTTDSASSVLVYPGYTDTGNFYSPDIAIIKLAQPLPGTPAIIAPASLNEMLTGVGFGTYGTPAIGEISPRNGYSHGFYAPMVSTFIPNVDNTYYDILRFDDTSGVLLNGHGLNGDSGGPVFDSDWNLIGMMDGQTGDASVLGTTEVLNFTQPDVYNWIEANTQVTPEPSTIALLSAGAIALLLIRRHRPFLLLQTIGNCR